MAKKVIKIIAIVLLLIVVYFIGYYGTRWLFNSQYNDNGISHFLVITIDKSRPKEYIGELEEHKVYVEGLKLEETNFRNMDADNVSIKDALDKKLVSIEEWEKYARKINKNDDGEVLQFENYEIVVTKDECIIKPF